MSVVCGVRFYILEAHQTVANGFWRWDKALKSLDVIIDYSVPDYYVLSPGSIIDVVQNGNKVSIVRKKTLAVDGPIEYVDLSSTSGSYTNTLLKATRSVYTLTVIMYSPVANETTTLEFTFQEFTTDSPAETITPCFYPTILEEDLLLKSYCDGFNLSQVYWRVSPEGVSTSVTVNSPTCGYSPVGDPVRITEEIIIEYKSCILDNPIMLVWKNLVGGWDYWLFQKNQVKSLQVESLGSFQKNYNKISDTTNPNTERGKVGQRFMVIGAEGLSTGNKLLLEGLYLSNKVYIINQDGSISREVEISTGTFIIVETEGDTHSIELQIEDVPVNTIRN